ncbi:MAG: hypothetical protein JRH20_07030 [Deltaproteobacteria bacterium]|nr:hypothetical protein [Deltaproteobacteria bacterium]
MLRSVVVLLLMGSLCTAACTAETSSTPMPDYSILDVPHLLFHDGVAPDTDAPNTDATSDADAISGADATIHDLGDSAYPDGAYPDGGCGKPEDCPSLVCTDHICQPSTCEDLVKNADETAIDCGGHCGATCKDGSPCDTQADCATRFCEHITCKLAPTCQALRDGGVIADGVYTIDPNGSPGNDAVAVFCDMTTAGFGWTALAANGEIAKDETTLATDCYPLISNDASAGCGDTSNLMNDFTLPGEQQAALSWRRLIAVAYGGTGYSDKLAYFGIDFGSAVPTTEERIGGIPYTPLLLKSAHGVMRCTNLSLTANIVHYTKAGTYAPNATYVANNVGTIFGHDTAPNMDGRSRTSFGFTDARDHIKGQVKGIDDYQDGWACGDSWVPQAVRGQRMVVLVN